MGWFYGFKLPALINAKGERIRFKRAPGNTDDRQPISDRCRGLFGQLFADQGSIAHGLTEALAQPDLQLITPLKKNMKPVPRTAFEKAIRRRRALIETDFGELKNLCQIEHTRYRSVSNFRANLMTGVIAYCLSGNKPTLALTRVNALAPP